MRTLLPVLLACHLLLRGATEAQSALAEGWLDASGRTPSARMIHKSWRALALSIHPDKLQGADGEVFADATRLRDAMKSPLHYQSFRALYGLAELRAFGSSADDDGANTAGGGAAGAAAGDAAGAAPAAGPVKWARASVEMKERIPYVTFEAKLALGGGRRLRSGDTWSFALGLQGRSTIQYLGNEDYEAGGGGYDVCCDFAAGSKCERTPLAAAPAAGKKEAAAEGEDQGAATGNAAEASASDAAAAAAAAATAEEKTQEKQPPPPAPPLPADYDHAHGVTANSSVYRCHDCPLRDPAVVSLTRPLHVTKAGRWAAVLLLRDAQGAELALAVAVLELDEAALQVPAADGQEGEGARDAYGEPSSGPQDADANANTNTTSSSSSEAKSKRKQRQRQKQKPKPRVTFSELSRGMVCADGGDILEGRIDGYTDCSPGNRVCTLTTKCRAKCRRNKMCQFYTRHESGFCQLSSTCDEQVPSESGSTMTYRKQPLKPKPKAKPPRQKSDDDDHAAADAGAAASLELEPEADPSADAADAATTAGGLPVAEKKPPPKVVQAMDELTVALRKAAESNDASGVEAALEGGAVVDGADTAGFTALMKASMKGRGFIVQTLLAAGAHVNLQSNGWTGLALAAEFDHAAVVRLLLAAGADPLLEDWNGESALSRAEGADVSELMQNHLDKQGRLDETQMYRQEDSHRGFDPLEDAQLVEEEEMAGQMEEAHGEL